MDYKIAQVSIQGKSHKKSDPIIPCQDFGKAGTLSNGLHIIIVSDGAGSSKFSHIASEFCVNSLYTNLESNDFSEFIEIPVDIELIKSTWRAFCLTIFKDVRSALLEKSRLENIQSGDLNCTLMLIVKTKWGFLCANIGDGRSGFSDGQAKELIVPFMTFTAGATYFLIKEDWERIFRSYVVLPESSEKVEYFFASSDGCQDFIIDWSINNPKTGIYDDILGDEAFYDSNKPYNPFFQGLIKSLKEVQTENEINERLKNLVENGIYVCDGETQELKSISSPLLDDDKTLIIFFK